MGDFMNIECNIARRGSSFSKLLLASVAALTLSACANQRSSVVVGDAVCASPVPPRRMPLPLATPAQRELLLGAGFSPEAVHIADVIGAVGSLLASIQPNEGANGEPGFNSFANNHVALSLDRGILEVQGTGASLSCQASRVAELQAELTQRQAVISNRYHLATLAVTAGAAVAGGAMGFLASSTPANITSITAGTIEGVLSILSLNINPSGHLRLQQNMMEEFWRAPETPTLFPQRVWRYLNTSINPGEPTPRERIIESWRRDHLIPDEPFTPVPPSIIMKRDAIASDELESIRLLIEPVEFRVGLMARSMGRLVEELLERSEATAMNRQAPPARRRAPAMAQAAPQNEQPSQRADTLPVEAIEAQTPPASRRPAALVQAAPQNEQQSQRAEVLPVQPVEAQAAPARPAPVAVAQALPQSEPQTRRADTLAIEPLEAQTPPARRRPLATTQAPYQNEQPTQRADALPVERLETQTPPARPRPAAPAQALPQNEQQPQRADTLPVERTVTQAPPARPRPAASAQAQPQNEQQSQRADGLSGEPIEARIALIARDLTRLLEELVARSEANAQNRQNVPARRRPDA